jgi:hypothetical protein
MTTIKISQLPDADLPLTGNEVVPLDQSGVTKKANISAINPVVNVKAFGAKGDGLVDDTAAIQAAVDYVFSNGGGTIAFPSGTYLVTTIVKVWTGAVTINLVGEGKRSTRIFKFGTSTNPVFDFSSVPGVLETYSEISDMSINGNNVAAAGIRLTNWARGVIRNVFINNCVRGLHSRGALVFSVYDCTIQSNVFGYFCEKSTDNIYANLVQFFGGQISANSTWGASISDASGVHFIGTDLSANGVAGNVSTGAIYIDSSVDDETGYANIALDGVWLEVNNGYALRVDGATGLILTVKDCVFSGNEDPATIGFTGKIFSSSITGCIAGSPSDTIVVNAERSYVANSVIAVLTDTSTQIRHINVGTSADQIADTFKGPFKRMELGTEDFLYGRSDQISGGGTNDIDFYLYGSGKQNFFVNATNPLSLGSAAIGFYGTAPIAKPTVTGSAGGNAALASLLTQLAALGLITDSST